MISSSAGGRKFWHSSVHLNGSDSLSSTIFLLTSLGAPFSYSTSPIQICDRPAGSLSGACSCRSVQQNRIFVRDTHGPSEHISPSGVGAFVSDLSSTDRSQCVRL